MTVNRPRSIKPRTRRTKAQIEQLQRQISEVLTDDHPQSVRHVFYRMTDPRLPEPVEKTDQGYKQVWYQITKMRRDGTLPYGWIADATRRGYHVPTYGDRAEFLNSVAGLYRADLWSRAGVYVEVWRESRSIASVIDDECERLAVSLYPCGGFASITFAYEAAQTINNRTHNGVFPAEVLFIGDYDPAGVLIDKALEAELRKHIRPSVDLRFRRLGITSEQIARYDLPTRPRKASDKRSLHIQDVVEAEAMPAGTLRQLLRDAVESFLPPGALHAAKVAEESERAAILDLAEWAV